MGGVNERSVCHICLRSVRTKVDGTFYQHGFARAGWGGKGGAGRTACTGSGKVPAGAPLKLADTWRAIDILTMWLDANSTMPQSELRLMRVMKVGEEFGEAIAATIGATGQNPRKGFTHTWDDVAGELCDVAVSALVALVTLVGDGEDRMARHLGGLLERAGLRLEGP